MLHVPLAGMIWATMREEGVCGWEVERQEGQDIFTDPDTSQSEGRVESEGRGNEHKDQYACVCVWACVRERGSRPSSVSQAV